MPPKIPLEKLSSDFILLQSSSGGEEAVERCSASAKADDDTRTGCSVGVYSTLNEEVTLQNHPLKEGVFKLNRIKVGHGCTLGINSFACYGITMSDNVILTADGFVS